MSAMDFLHQIRLGSYQLALSVPGILKLCNYLQNVAAITYIFGLQLSTFLFYNKQRTRMSKRGSRAFRYALMNAAHNVVKNNATFKTYYDKKRDEGRSHYNALGHCAGKLVRIIYKMLTDDITFDLD